MKIAAVAGSSPERERVASRWPAAEWTWVEDVSDLAECQEADLYLDMAFSMDKVRIDALRKLLPAPVMINSMVHTLKEIGHPFIRINGWPGLSEKALHELAVTDGAELQVASLYEKWKMAYRIVPDVPGMVSGRVLSMIVNEAYYTLQEEVSTKQEIDTAMKLGTNYPYGPFEWSDLIGLEKIHTLLTRLSNTDDRYIPARLLMETVAAGLKKD